MPQCAWWPPQDWPHSACRCPAPALMKQPRHDPSSGCVIRDEAKAVHVARCGWAICMCPGLARSSWQAAECIVRQPNLYACAAVDRPDTTCA